MRQLDVRVRVLTAARKRNDVIHFPLAVAINEALANAANATISIEDNARIDVLDELLFLECSTLTGTATSHRANVLNVPSDPSPLRFLDAL